MSTSDATSESQIQSKKQTPRHSKIKNEPEHSLLIPHDERSSSAESSIEDDSSEINAIQVKEKLYTNENWY